jgi:hypothetical protein
MKIAPYILSKNPTKRSFILNADVAALPELLPKLASRGCRNLYGFGVVVNVYDMPLYTQIKYEVNDKRGCHFPDNFFDMIVDASGENDDLLKNEYHRLLKDGGVMVLKGKAKWLIFRANKKPERRLPKEINIVVSTKGIPEGIRYTTDIMRKRLEENGIKVNLCKDMGEARRGIPTILEWMPYMPLPRDRKVIVEAHDLPTLNNIGFSFYRIFSDARYWMYAPIYAAKFLAFQKRNMEAKRRMKKHLLIVRTYELAEKGGIKDYYIMPHCLPEGQAAVEKLQERELSSRKPLCLGAYGFAAWYKNFEETCRIAKRLNIRLVMLLSINYNNKLAVKETRGNALKLKRKYGNKLIRIKIGEWTNEQIRKELGPATHMISTQVSVDNISSSMRFAYSLGKPIISLDNYQAKEAQVIRVAPENITKRFLENTRNERIYMDDGTRYLLKTFGCVNWKKYC